jgi:hypothetical protein
VTTERNIPALFPQRGGPQHVIDFGTAYTPSPHRQLDFHWSFGLSAATPDHSIGFGYSVRFQTQVIDRDMAVFSFSFYARV